MIEEKNYYETNNKSLTNSKIKDWLKDKHFFFRKHIKGDIEKKITDPLIIGSAVDTYITESKEAFDKKYYIVSRRNKKAPDYEFQLNGSMYEEITKIAESVLRQDAYKEIDSDYKTQSIIQIPLEKPGKYFDRFCGKPDWYKVKYGVCTIIDLKTCQGLGDRPEKKYYYQCLDYNYFMQQAMYQMILFKLHPEIKEFCSLHLVVEKDTDDIYNCHTFHLSQDTIEREKKDILGYIEEIIQEEEFKPKNISFSQAITIGEDKEEY
jgi:hypothetical protein